GWSALNLALDDTEPGWSALNLALDDTEHSAAGKTRHTPAGTTVRKRTTRPSAALLTASCAFGGSNRPRAPAKVQLDARETSRRGLGAHWWTFASRTPPPAASPAHPNTGLGLTPTGCRTGVELE
ncbi:MAG: hypothetical protein LBK72_05880, partial [Bifidobacteriaceae bacterium]|nr:hypothetical protein [Bifidobacteriaceae bacterium]